MLRETYIEDLKGQLKDRLQGGHRYSPGSLPSAAKAAKARVGLVYLFEVLSRMGYLTLTEEPDDMSIDDLTYGIEDDSVIKDVIRSVEAGGVWCACLMVNLPDRIDTGAAIGGFIGDDFDEYGWREYGAGMIEDSLDVLAEEFGWPRWKDLAGGPEQKAWLYLTTLKLLDVDVEAQDIADAHWT